MNTLSHPYLITCWEIAPFRVKSLDMACLVLCDGDVHSFVAETPSGVRLGVSFDAKYWLKHVAWKVNK